jgi:hypothetical protein
MQCRSLPGSSKPPPVLVDQKNTSFPPILGSLAKASEGAERGGKYPDMSSAAGLTLPAL